MVTVTSCKQRGLARARGRTGGRTSRGRTEEVCLSDDGRSIRFGVLERHRSRQHGKEVEGDDARNIELCRGARLSEDQDATQDELLQVSDELEPVVPTPVVVRIL